MKETVTRPLADVPDEELRERDAAMQAELDVLREQEAALTARCGECVKSQQQVQEELAHRHLERAADAHNWPYLLEENGYSNKVRYDAAQKALGSLAKLGHHEGLSMSGYLPATNQRGLRVSLLKGKPELTARVAEAVQMLLPYIVPLPEERGRGGYKYLSVFESSLSEHGKYTLAIDEARALFELRITRCGRESTVHAASSVLDLLQYIEQHLPYSSD